MRSAMDRAASGQEAVCVRKALNGPSQSEHLRRSEWLSLVAALRWRGAAARDVISGACAA